MQLNISAPDRAHKDIRLTFKRNKICLKGKKERNKIHLFDIHTGTHNGNTYLTKQKTSKEKNNKQIKNEPTCPVGPVPTGSCPLTYAAK